MFYGIIKLLGRLAVKEAVKEFHAKIKKLYGQRLKEVILYGSWARGEATAESDIDLLVVLDGEVRPGQEIDRMIEIMTEINLKHAVLISVYPISEAAYTTLNSPLLLNVRKEGVPA
ncbi:MAG: nucleotidyltransferase domain-containing protein [Anaerolineae bacterium]|nr:nucleotidyltransferase domain-containing protein [Anaerolineae bacterium]